MTLPDLNKICFLLLWVKIHLSINSPLWTIKWYFDVHVVSYEAINFILALECSFWIRFKMETFVKGLLFWNHTIVIITELLFYDILKFIICFNIVLTPQLCEPGFVILAFEACDAHVVYVGLSGADIARLIHNRHRNQTKDLCNYCLMRNLENHNDCKNEPAIKFKLFQPKYNSQQNKDFDTGPHDLHFPTFIILSSFIFAPVVWQFVSSMWNLFPSGSAHIELKYYN